MIIAALLIAPQAAEAQLCIAAFDSAGMRVATASLDGNVADAWFDQGNQVTRLEVRRNSLEGNTTVYFTELDCTGIAYIERSGLVTQAHLVGNSVTFADATANEVPNALSASQRFGGTGECLNGQGSVNNAQPTLTFSIPTFSPPFHLEAEDCFSTMSMASPPTELLSAVAIGMVAVLVLGRRFLAPMVH